MVRLDIKSTKVGESMHSFDSEVRPKGELMRGLRNRQLGFLAISCTLISICLPQSLLRLILMEMSCETRKEDETNLWNTQGPYLIQFMIDSFLRTKSKFWQNISRLLPKHSRLWRRRLGRNMTLQR